MSYTGINHGNLWNHAIGMARTAIRTGTPVRHLVVNHPFFLDAANHADPLFGLDLYIKIDILPYVQIDT